MAKHNNNHSKLKWMWANWLIENKIKWQKYRNRKLAIELINLCFLIKSSRKFSHFLKKKRVVIADFFGNHGTSYMKFYKLNDNEVIKKVNWIEKLSSKNSLKQYGTSLDTLYIIEWFIKWQKGSITYFNYTLRLIF